MKLAPGDRFHVLHVSTRDAMRDFTCLEVFQDGWARAVDDDGRLRMFDLANCRRVEREHA